MEEISELEKQIDLIDIELNNIRMTREARGEKAYSCREIILYERKAQLQFLYRLNKRDEAKEQSI